jgi:hypothetical protein
MTTVNNYAFGRYDDGEVWIQTEPRQLATNNGKVYLTVGELHALLACAEERSEFEATHIGFSGTRNRITDEQQTALRQIFYEIDQSTRLRFVPVLHHGDCINADAFAHEMARERSWEITIHPPTDHKARAFCQGYTRIRPQAPYMVRNQAIVDAVDRLIAAPSVPEILRSGTWATVRRARRRGIPITIIWPSGQITEEQS